MNNQLRFDGQVAIVTGAGGGLGREYALLLAERGAAVVVNDLGGSRSGEGHNVSAADKVVQEIKAKGGKAVADYNTVENGDKIVKTAIDNFGRLDILINNAGILRDKSFLKISKEDWDSVIGVHLRGSFLVTKAAWPYFRKQGYGRIIMTASGAGIYGNFGQSNYASAKLGLLGLSNTLAVEGSKYNIHCNTIVPLAASRLTQDIFPPEWFEQLKPEFISPVVVWLCHSSCEDNGGIFEAAGGWVGKYRWQRSVGKAFVAKDEKVTVESVRDNWHEITDMTDASNPISIHDQTTLLLGSLTNAGKEHSKPSKDSSTFSYNQDHAILYALGVGMSTSDPDHLQFLYEGSTNFQVLPTFGSIIAMPTLFDSAALNEQIKNLSVDPTKLLHGEQYLELIEPLPSATTVTSVCRIIDVLDKGSGAVVIADVDTYNEHGVKMMTSQWSLFFVGAGNFGGKRSTNLAKEIVDMPNRKPDFVVVEKTDENQAALYRLCGDKNPLHIDPAFAAMGGFKQPIMHGLCTYGHACRHVLKQYAGNDVAKFKSMKARFSGSIEPGQTIQTEMWRDGNRILYECSNVETGKKLISGGYVDLHSVNASAGPNVGIPAQVPKDPSGGDPPPSLKTDLVFAEMGNRLPELPDLAQKTQAIFEWNITQNGKPAAQWILDLKNGAGSVYRGPIKEGKPHCTLTLEDDTMFDMVIGKLDPRKAFMSGKLKVKGNIMLTQKLTGILASKGPKAMAAAEEAKAKSVASATPQGGQTKLRSDAVFQGYLESIKRNPQFIEVQHIYQWNITKNGKLMAEWTFDLKTGPAGDAYRGPPKNGLKADCIFTLEDDIMVDMADGKLDSQKAFMTGKLKIQGDVLASEKLYDLREDYISKEKEEKRVKESLPQGASGSPPPPPAPPADEVPISVKSDIIFKIFQERLGEEPEVASKMKVCFHWIILRDGRKMTDWTVDLKTGTGAIYKGEPKLKPDVTITLEDEDTINLMGGKLNPQRAFMTGKLKIKGNIMLTQKLNQLWQEIIKSGRAVELPLLEPILADKPLDPKLFSEFAFLDLARKLSRLPDLVTKTQSIFDIQITKDGKPATQWTLDLKYLPGGIYRGPSKKDKPVCTLTIDDRDFNQLVLGRYPAEHAFAKGGRVKISGDRAKGEKVAELFKEKSKL